MKRTDLPRPEDLSCLVDLHLHLDGALSPASVRALAAAQDIPVPADETELLKLIRVGKDCRSLNDFLTKFAFPCSLLQTAGALTAAVRTLLCELKEQGVMYAEIRFAPQLSTEKGLSQSEVVEAAVAGLADAPIPAQLILCCMLGAKEEVNRETVLTAGRYLGKGVCALDIAGAEALYPLDGYAGLFSLARSLRVPSTIHAGEAAGADNIRTALRFGASRIGHGVRAGEDPALVRELARRGIPLEMCPTSNLCTAVLSDLADYPLRAFTEAGVCVTVNTDDPSIEGTTLREEYRALIDSLGLTRGEVTRLLCNAVDASFAPGKLKRRMKRQVRAALKAV